MNAVNSADPTPSLHPNYRRDGDHWLIEVKLREPRQFFHTLDPAPFREKDLDPDAERYIEEAAREIGTDKALRLVLHLPAIHCASEDARTLPAAVANYFAGRARQTRIELRRLLQRGAMNLVIGLAFLVICLWLRRALAAAGGHEVLAEGLLIIGWVGLWRPVEIFLYDWWPMWRQQQRMAAIAGIEVVVVAEK